MDGKRTKKNRNKTKFHLVIRTVSNRKHNQRGIQYRPRHNKHGKTIQLLNAIIQLFKDYYMPKQTTYHICGDFLVETRRKRNPEEHWRKLVKSLEKNCEFKDVKPEELLFSKFITNITDKKLREKLIRERTVNVITTMDLVTQSSYVKEKKLRQEPIKKYKTTIEQTKTRSPEN